MARSSILLSSRNLPLVLSALVGVGQVWHNGKGFPGILEILSFSVSLEPDFELSLN